MSQWVGDIAIDNKQLCDQQLGSSTHNLENLYLLHKIHVVRRQAYYASKSKSSQTLQDIYVEPVICHRYSLLMPVVVQLFVHSLVCSTITCITLPNKQVSSFEMFET